MRLTAFHYVDPTTIKPTLDWWQWREKQHNTEIEIALMLNDDEYLESQINALLQFWLDWNTVVEEDGIPARAENLYGVL